MMDSGLGNGSGDFVYFVYTDQLGRGCQEFLQEETEATEAQGKIARHCRWEAHSSGLASLLSLASCKKIPKPRATKPSFPSFPSVKSLETLAEVVPRPGIEPG